MTFLSPSAAGDYIRQKLRDFYAQKAILLDQQQQVRVLKDQAVKQKKSLGPVLALEAEVQNSLTRHGRLEYALAPFSKWLGVPTGQLGIALPLVLAGVAIPAAALLYLHFQKVRAHQQALDLISRGLLTPEQAAALGAKPLFALGDFGVTPLLLLAVLGGGLLLFGGRR